MDRTRMGLSEHSETQRGFIHFAVCFTPQLLIGGWAYPSEKWWSEFVSWDDDIPNIYIYRYIWKVIKFMFLKPPSSWTKPMVPMFWTNTDGPNESHANAQHLGIVIVAAAQGVPIRWSWLRLASCDLAFKVKSNGMTWVEFQHHSLCIFQVLEQSVFGGCCRFFLQKMIPILREKYIQWSAATHESLSTPTPALGNGMCLKILSKWSSKQAGQSGRHF